MVYMKRIAILTLPCIAYISIASCGSSGNPFGGTNGYDPLDAPGGNTGVENRDPFGPSISPGSYLQTTSPQTAFFTHAPQEGDLASKHLGNYTDVKIISTAGTYAKVEVADTGEIGYVPTVMLGARRAPEITPVSPDPTAVPKVPQPDPVAPDIAPTPKPNGTEPPDIVDPSRPAE